MSFRQFEATPEAIRRAREIGVYGDTAKRLARAARRSAPHTSDRGNRRFYDLALLVQGNLIVWVNRLAPQAA